MIKNKTIIRSIIKSDVSGMQKNLNYEIKKYNNSI